MVLSASAVLLIIGIRAVRDLGFVLGLGGVLLPAAATMTLTLVAAVRPNLQGILLTTIALGLFIIAMTLAPARAASISRWPSVRLSSCSGVTARACGAPSRNAPKSPAL